MKIGDVVRLASGGPEMVVEYTQSVKSGDVISTPDGAARAMFSGSDVQLRVGVAWMTADGQLCRDELWAIMLVHADATKGDDVGAMLEKREG